MDVFVFAGTLLLGALVGTAVAVPGPGFLELGMTVEDLASSYLAGPRRNRFIYYEMQCAFFFLSFSFLLAF